MVSLSKYTMSKTIVNIITEDNPISAYLFIKEMYEIGDSLMYISAKDTEDDLDLLAEIDGVPSDIIEEVVLKNDEDEFSYERICRTVKEHLKPNVHYCVNLAGGTRYMALAVQQVFEDYDSEFFYMDVEDNIIVKSKFDDNIFNNDDFHSKIKHRMSLDEYFKIHEIKSDSKKNHCPLHPANVSQSMFDLASQELFTRRDYYIFDILRSQYRNKKKFYLLDDIISPSNDSLKAIPDIGNFLDRVNYLPKNSDRLTREDIDFLTGGWFEEYVYYMVKRMMNPQDIAMGITIHPKNVERQNELDVVFMKGNKLFVIECKTGVEGRGMFNAIVYKACALKESLFGMSCYSCICSLIVDDEVDNLRRIANNMDIDFIDKEMLTDVDALSNKFSEMIRLSKD